MLSNNQADKFRAPWRRRASSSGLFRAPKQSRAGSSGHFGRHSGSERGRAAISSAPAEPSGLAVANVGRFAVFEPGRAALSPRASKRSKASCRKFQLNIFVCVILSGLIAPIHILLRVALQALQPLSALPQTRVRLNTGYWMRNSEPEGSTRPSTLCANSISCGACMCELINNDYLANK